MIFSMKPPFAKDKAWPGNSHGLIVCRFAVPQLKRSQKLKCSGAAYALLSGHARRVEHSAAVLLILPPASPLSLPSLKYGMPRAKVARARTLRLAWRTTGLGTVLFQVPGLSLSTVAPYGPRFCNIALQSCPMHGVCMPPPSLDTTSPRRSLEVPLRSSGPGSKYILSILPRLMVYLHAL